MFGAVACRGFLFSLAVTLLILGGCARPPDIGKTLLTPKSFTDLQAYFSRNEPQLDEFRVRGPFDVIERNNREIRFSANEQLSADLYLSGHAEKAPLVIFLHGHDSTKENHAYQGMHVASWGMHALALQLPGKGPWLDNGFTLGNLVRFIQREPARIDSRVDPGKIILVGHSFGGAATAVAMGSGAPVIGGILLDPAVDGFNLAPYLARVSAPLMLLGADEAVSAAVNREDFFSYRRERVYEVSIRDASHEDAQFPATAGPVTEALQITFAAALTSAALSVSSRGSFDDAWAGYGNAFKRGSLFNARRK